MKIKERLVFDTSVLVSGVLLPGSISAQAVGLAIDSANLLVSEETLNELADVLSRQKFDRYIGIKERQEFLQLVGSVAEFVPAGYAIRACRDSKDVKFLEAAISGAADLIVTGDADLLVLHPFRGVPILTSTAYLGRYSQSHSEE